MIVASIDIGTNTVLLLIAEVNIKTGKLKPLLNEYRIPRIGHGVKETKLINPSRVSLLFGVIKEYETIIKNYKCEKVIVTGTNALRIAENTSEISNELKKLFNYDLEVISGDMEAEYAYLGAISDINRMSTSLIIDIGGGSTELIFGSNTKIDFKASLQMGSVSATEEYLKHSPPLNSEVEALKFKIKNMINIIKKNKIPENIIAIAGTATTLACMIYGLKEFEDSRVEMSTISSDEINVIINQISKMRKYEILERYGSVMRGREDIILAGAIILSEVMLFFGIKKFIVSSRGIRYGAVVKFLKTLN